MENQSPSSLPSSSEENVNEYQIVDVITCARCGSLSAHGLSDMQIAAALFLSDEQILAARKSTAFKKKYAEDAETAIQAQIDRDDGWDAVEERAIKNVLESLEYNRDPKYALGAAAIANKAIRRKGSATDPKVLDNSQPQTNIIVLSMNKTYIQKNDNRQINVPQRDVEQPQRRSDLPTPKAVAELLAPVKEVEKKQLSTVEQYFAEAGVVFDGEGGAG